MKKNIRLIFVAGVCVCLCVGYYYYLSHRSGKEKQLSSVDQVITLDLEKNYPKTPREVVRFYNRILECLYNEDCSEEQLQKLAKQARIMMDDELAERNAEDDYYLRLLGEVTAFEEEKKEIVNITISTASDVEKKKVNGDECAYVDVSYFMKADKESERTNQTYILRKNTEGKWKILGFYK